MKLFLLALTLCAFSAHAQLVTVFDADELVPGASATVVPAITGMNREYLPQVGDEMYFFWADSSDIIHGARSTFSSGLIELNLVLNGTEDFTLDPYTSLGSDYRDGIASAVFQGSLYFSAGSDGVLQPALYKYDTTADEPVLVMSWSSDLSDSVSASDYARIVGTSNGGLRLWVRQGIDLYYIDEDLDEWNTTVAASHPLVTKYESGTNFTSALFFGSVIEHDNEVFYHETGVDKLWRLNADGPELILDAFNLANFESTSGDLYFSCDLGNGLDDEVCTWNGTGVTQFDLVVDDSRRGCSPYYGSNPAGFAEDAFGTVYVLHYGARQCDGGSVGDLPAAISSRPGSGDFGNTILFNGAGVVIDDLSNLVYLAGEDRFYFTGLDDKHVWSYSPGAANATTEFTTISASAADQSFSTDGEVPNVFSAQSAGVTSGVVAQMRAEVVSGEEGNVVGGGVLAGVYDVAVALYTPGFLPDQADGESTEEDIVDEDDTSSSSLGPIIGGVFVAIGVGLGVGFLIATQRAKTEGAKRLVQESKA